MTGVPDLALPVPEIPFITDPNLTSFLWSAPDLMAERINGIISAMDAHSAPSTQTLILESSRVGLLKLPPRQACSMKT